MNSYKLHFEVISQSGYISQAIMVVQTYSSTEADQFGISLEGNGRRFLFSEQIFDNL